MVLLNLGLENSVIRALMCITPNEQNEANLEIFILSYFCVRIQGNLKKLKDVDFVGLIEEFPLG